MPPSMRLADFILSNLEEILREWEEFARSLAPGSAMSVMALRDHAESILRVTARDMLSPQTAEQQSDKSKGHGGGGDESAHLDDASKEHALERLASGFDVIQVVSEYRALRASVLHLWRETVGNADTRDLEDLVRFNESIDQSLAQAVKSYTTRLDESRELFVAMLGHDLRAPLTAMMLSAEVLARSGHLDDENIEIASRITTFGKAMAAMIHDLLDFTRIRLGRGIPLSVAPADLAAVCREVLAQFQTAYFGRTLHFTLDGDVSGAWDAARLRQVISNLVANALEHGDDGSDVEVLAAGSGEDVSLTVKNRGAAIPPTALTSIFDPFVHADKQRTASRHEGVGLGLFIAREIVTAHGGTVSVASSEATGTVFNVRLPRHPSPATLHAHM